MIVFGAGFIAALCLRLPDWIRGLAALAALLLGTASGWRLARWSLGRQTFRLVRADPLTGIVTIALNDTQRTADARAESDRLWDAILQESGGGPSSDSSVKRGKFKP